jgi:transglutaminase-like putative cysteine protease
LQSGIDEMMDVAKNKNFSKKLTLRAKYFFLLIVIITILIACQPGLDDSDQIEIKATFQESEEINNADILNTSPQRKNRSLVILDSVEYDIQQRLKLVNNGPGNPSKQNLWVALLQDVDPYQEVIEREINPENYQLITDEYGNLIAEFDFSVMPPESEIQVKIDYRVKVNQVEYDLSTCIGELPNFYTDSDLHVESENPQIISLSEDLVSAQETVCKQVRAIYDYVGNELVYSYNGGNWGAQAALGKMGADCTEYASLMIALSRAAGIPARYVEGLSFTPEGKESLARQEHAWLEVYLPGSGWTPMDPTLGRSSITREQYFAKLPADHIIVTRGRNPSVLRGGSYWTYLYWHGNSTEIKI